MLRLILCFLALSAVSIRADDSPADNTTADIEARVKALTPTPGQPLATYPVPREDWMARFVGNLDKLKQGPYEAVFDGDSITDWWQLEGRVQKQYPNLKLLIPAIAGDRVEQVLWRVQHGELDGQDPKFIMLMIGTNNSGQAPKDIAAGIKLVIGEYETRCPHANILLLGLFPRAWSATAWDRGWIKSVNAVLATSFTSDPRVTYMDIGDKFLEPDGSISKEVLVDSLHPSTKGYAIWAAAIQPVIDKYFPNATAPNPLAK